MEHIGQITQVLGGTRTLAKKPRSDRDFINVVRAGLPVRAVACAADWLSLTEDQAFALLRISKRTATRRKAKQERLRDVESERLLRLARAAATAADVLGTREKAVRWLTRSNRALGGEAPVRMLDTDVGFQNVLDVLHRVEHGVYS